MRFERKNAIRFVEKWRCTGGALFTFRDRMNYINWDINKLSERERAIYLGGFMRTLLPGVLFIHNKNKL